MGKKGMSPATNEKLRIKMGLGAGTKLRRLRVKKGLSQTELSAISGVSIQNLRRFEQSEKTINGAKLKTLIALCESLGCKIEHILEDEELAARFRATK